MMTCRIVFPDAKILEAVIDALSAVLDTEATLKITENGMAARGLDDAHVSLVDLELGRELFEEWDVEPCEVTLSLPDVRKALKLKKGQRAILEVNDKAVKITLVDEKSYTEKAFTFRTIEFEAGAVKIPSIGFTAEAKASTRAIADTVSLLARIDSQVKIIMNEKLRFEAVNESVRAADEYSPNGIALYELRVSRPAEACFSTVYLERIMKAARKLSSDMTIRLATDTPIEISPEIPGGRLTYLLAPIISR